MRLLIDMDLDPAELRTDLVVEGHSPSLSCVHLHQFLPRWYIAGIVTSCGIQSKLHESNLVYIVLGLFRVNRLSVVGCWVGRRFLGFYFLACLLLLVFIVLMFRWLKCGWIPMQMIL